MVDFHAWLGRQAQVHEAARAVDAWNRILEKPSQIEVVRDRVKLAAQTVRIEFGNVINEVTSAGSGTSGVQRVVVFGVRSHPDVPDADLRRDDRFQIDGHWYRIVALTRTKGEVQATAEALS